MSDPTSSVATRTAHNPATKLRMLAPLESRDFRLLWTGMVASLLGDGVFVVAVAWQVYQLANAPAALAAVGIAAAMPQVVLLLAGGVVSDRFDRLRVMIAADLIRGVAIATIGVLAIGGWLTLPWLIGLVVLYGAASAFFGPSFDAIVPELVPSAQLTEANALDQFMRPTALRLAGPALGGAVVAIAGAGYGFLFDAATFAFSATCMSLMSAGGAWPRASTPRRSRCGRSQTACGSSDRTSGCGARSSARQRAICCSSARRRCCCRS